MEINSPVNSPPPRVATGSPPPKCAICLGTFTNKCYSNSCMHEFCFKCLLEWSKVKPECPLCKQSFKSIIHNIKSNEEYDEHIVGPPPSLGTPIRNGDFLYLQPTPSRHFQFRTTFTVDPGGEFAIQQMLLSHPLTNTMYNMHAGGYFPRHGTSRYRVRQGRRASSVTSFRRSIYDSGLWVRDIVEHSGRSRDISPNYFRDNPAARHRLAPWLNRELNALLRENTQQVMNLVDIIMDHLTRWHIQSRSFKTLLQQHLTTKTDHFIHEFSNFMKSPYDMINYDRNIMYAERPILPLLLILSDHEDDSDVAIVSEPVARNNNPFESPTIEVIEINSDSSHESDIIIGENPEPEIVNLVDSDTNEPPPPAIESLTRSSSEESRKPILPLKVRLKRKRQSRETSYLNKQGSKFNGNQSGTSSPISTTNSSNSSNSSDSSDLTSSTEPQRCKRKSKYRCKKPKTRCYKTRTVSRKLGRRNSRLNEDSSTSSSDSEDSLPPRKLRIRKGLESSRTYQPASSRTHTVTSRNLQNTTLENNSTVTQRVDDVNETNPSCSLWNTTATLASGTVSPPQLGSPTTLLDNICQLSENNGSELERHLTFGDYLLPDYATSSNNTELYNNSQNYDSTLFNLSPYSSPRIGPRYYNCDYNDRGDNYSENPTSDFVNENGNMFIQPKLEIPSRIVTPNDNGGPSSYFTHSDSHNKRLQSVIVKKEDYLLSDSSDN